MKGALLGLSSLFPRRHAPTSPTASEPTHFDPRGMSGSSVNAEEAHQWADLSLHRLPRWRERHLSRRWAWRGGLCQAGLPSALSSHEGLKEGRKTRQDSREGASDRRDQAKIKGLLTQPVFTREYEFRGGLLKYQNFSKDQITQEMLRMSPEFSIPEE